MIDTDQKKPDRGPNKDTAARAKALRENLRRRKARERAFARENAPREREPAPQSAPEDEATWTR
jgi:hypothetical protein